MDQELVNGSVPFSSIEDLMHSSDWKKKCLDGISIPLWR